MRKRSRKKKNNVKDESYKETPLVALNKIKATEEEARGIINEAREVESLRIIQNAQADAKKIKDNLLEETKRLASVRKIEIIKQAEEDAKKIRKKSQDEIMRFRQQTQVLMAEAVEKTAEKIQKLLSSREF